MRTSRLLLAGFALAAAPAPVTFEDDAIRVEVPAVWSVEGQAGEYVLLSDGEDAASLLLLLSEFDGTLHERLAEIEQQFVETGIIEPDFAENRALKGDHVHYRRYRLTLGGPQAEEGPSILLHQYSFERAGVPVLLQAETAPGGSSQEELFEMVFATLEIREPPEVFRFEDILAAPADSGQS